MKARGNRHHVSTIQVFLTRDTGRLVVPAWCSALRGTPRSQKALMSEFQLKSSLPGPGVSRNHPPIGEGISPAGLRRPLLGVTSSGQDLHLRQSSSRFKRPTRWRWRRTNLARSCHGEFNSSQTTPLGLRFYQPEAYVPSSDTFIEGCVDQRDHIEQIRLSTAEALLGRKDAIIVT